MDLLGRVKFPTGGIVRERNALNRCNSDTDSKVWMEEDTHILRFYALSVSTQGIFRRV